MAKVTVLFNNQPQAEYNLEKDEHRVGRAADCDVVVDNMGVSRHHCSFVKEGDNWIVVDQGSNNGTFLNGKRIDGRQQINHKERVVLGKHSIEYDAHGTADPSKIAAAAGGAAAGGGSEMTMFVDPEQMKKMQEELKKGGQAMVLSIMQGGREVKVPLVKQETIIGKMDGADVPVKGMFIKAIQAKIIKADSGYRLVSMGGFRGVKVNGRKASNHNLTPGDMIQVAGVVISYKKQ